MNITKIIKNIVLAVALCCFIACDKTKEINFAAYELMSLSEINVLDFESISSSDHDMIQKAINYASDNEIDIVFVPEGVYEIDAAGVHGDKGIAMKEGITLKLDSNAVLRAIPNNATNYSIVRIHNVNNVKIMGGTIEGDRNTHIGTTGEWGMGVDIREASNVEIYNTLIKNCWGDGIYIGGTSPSLNVMMDMVTCDSNRRQGISVVHGDGIFLKNSTLSNTRGKAPQAGIDLEPNVGQYVMNVEITNTSFLKNTGPGFFAYAGTGDVSNVSIRNCISDNNSHAGINFNGGEPTSGSKNLRNVSISNVTIIRSPLVGLTIRESNDISVDSITIVDSRQRAVRVTNSENISLKSFKVDDVRVQAIVITNSDSVSFKGGEIVNLLAQAEGVFIENSRSINFSDIFISGGTRGIVGQNVAHLLLDSLDLSYQNQYGVLIDSAFSSEISNSEFKHIAQAPVQISNAIGNQIEGNTLLGNCFQDHGIYAQIFIEGISSDNTIINNIIQDSIHLNKSKYGIWLGINTYDNIVTGNSINSNSYSVADIYDESGSNVIY